MSNIKDKLNNDIKTAMKQKASDLVKMLRNINAVIKQYEVDNRGVEITDAVIISLLNKMLKQRHESILAYQKGNRLDLAQIEESEIFVIKNIIVDNNLTSMKDLGTLMKLSKEHFKNQNVDFSIVSTLGKELLK